MRFPQNRPSNFITEQNTKITGKKKLQKRKIPKNVNSEKNGRVEASTGDNLRLSHSHGLRHPVQERQVRLEIQIDEFAHQVPSAPGASPLAIDVPFGKVNSVIYRLYSQQSEGQQKRECTQYVDQSRHPNVAQSRH